MKYPLEYVCNLHLQPHTLYTQKSPIKEMIFAKETYDFMYVIFIYNRIQYIHIQIQDEHSRNMVTARGSRVNSVHTFTHVVFIYICCILLHMCVVFIYNSISYIHIQIQDGRTRNMVTARGSRVNSLHVRLDCCCF